MFYYFFSLPRVLKDKKNTRGGGIDHHHHLNDHYDYSMDHNHHHHHHRHRHQHQSMSQTIRHTWIYSMIHFLVVIVVVHFIFSHFRSKYTSNIAIVATIEILLFFFEINMFRWLFGWLLFICSFGFSARHQWWWWWWWLQHKAIIIFTLQNKV